MFNEAWDRCQVGKVNCEEFGEYPTIQHCVYITYN